MKLYSTMKNSRVSRETRVYNTPTNGNNRTYRARA